MINQLIIKNLVVTLPDQGSQAILRGVNLEVKPGQIHVLLGPNGAGKSTLGAALLGNPDFVLTAGEVTLDGQDITNLSPEERAQAGSFLAFQAPVSIPGVSVAGLLQAALNAQRQAKGEGRILSAKAFLAELETAAKASGFPLALLDRSFGEGFSGGEKKRLELLQLELFKPKYAVLDETDSGLDVEGMRAVAATLERARARGCGILLITHQNRLLDIVKANKVSILINGQIVATGGAELAKQIEACGYKGFGVDTNGILHDSRMAAALDDDIKS